jgi:hypothetical protein
MLPDHSPGDTQPLKAFHIVIRLADIPFRFPASKVKRHEDCNSAGVILSPDPLRKLDHRATQRACFSWASLREKCIYGLSAPHAEDARRDVVDDDLEADSRASR